MRTIIISNYFFCGVKEVRAETWWKSAYWGGHLKKAHSREGQKCVWTFWPQCGLWIEAWGSKSSDRVRVWARERKLGLGIRTGNFMSKSKQAKKLHTKPLITLLYGLKLYTTQYVAWCPLTGEGKQNASLDTWSMLVLKTQSIRRSASFISFWYLCCIITLPYTVNDFISGQSYINIFKTIQTDFNKTYKNESDITFSF